MRQLKKEIWPHRIIMDKHESFTEVACAEAWLEKTYGKRCKRWNIVFGYSSTHFYFKEGRDATLFSLSCL